MVSLRDFSVGLEQRQDTLAVKPAAHQEQPRLSLRIARRSHQDLMNVPPRIESGERHKLIQSGVPGGDLGEKELAERRRPDTIDIDTRNDFCVRHHQLQQLRIGR